MMENPVVVANKDTLDDVYKKMDGRVQLEWKRENGVATMKITFNAGNCHYVVIMS